MECSKLNCKHCMNLDSYVDAVSVDPYNDTYFLPPDGKGYCHVKHFICPSHWANKVKRFFKRLYEI